MASDCVTLRNPLGDRPTVGYLTRCLKMANWQFKLSEHTRMVVLLSEEGEYRCEITTADLEFGHDRCITLSEKEIDALIDAFQSLDPTEDIKKPNLRPPVVSYDWEK